MVPSLLRLLVTRKLPDAVEGRLAQSYDARLNPDDRTMMAAEIVAAAKGCDGLLITSADNFRTDLMTRLPATVRIVATFSVGYEHINLAAARERGIAVTNTPDVLTDATADIAMLLILGAARGRSWG